MTLSAHPEDQVPRAAMLRKQGAESNLDTDRAVPDIPHADDTVHNTDTAYFARNGGQVQGLGRSGEQGRAGLGSQGERLA